MNCKRRYEVVVDSLKRRGEHIGGFFPSAGGISLAGG